MNKSTDFSSKKIAINTIALYCRSVVSMLIALYSSRLLLQILGVADFGIYNAVGGMVMLFSFLNASLTVASQRFLNYAMGKGNHNMVNKIFCMSVNILGILALIMAIFSEIGGLILLYNYLSIPPERKDAAFVILHFSVISLFVTIVCVPFNAMIVAKEDMKSFAYVDVCGSALKLLTVCSLTFIQYDSLIMYAFFILLTQVVIGCAYIKICHYKYSEVRYHVFWDSTLFRRMLAFSGWTTLSSVTMIFRNQGLVVLYNAFCGVVVSAAIGIANQVNNALNTLVSNFTISFNPQITKNYASGNWEQCYKLHTSGPKFSFFLLSVAAVPFFLFGRDILKLWLNEVPEYTVLFLHLILIDTLLKSMTSTSNTVVRATEKVQSYELVCNSVILFFFFISYLCFVRHMPIETPFVCMIAATVLINLYISYRSCKAIGLKWMLYLQDIFIRQGFSFILPMAVILACNIGCCGLWDLILKSVSCMFIVMINEFLIGFNSKEKLFCKNILKRIVGKIKNGNYGK